MISLTAFPPVAILSVTASTSRPMAYHQRSHSVERPKHMSSATMTVKIAFNLCKPFVAGNSWRDPHLNDRFLAV
jgi:hypothetical protein